MRWILAIATLLTSWDMVNAVPEAGTQAISPRVLEDILYYARHAAAADRQINPEDGGYTSADFGDRGRHYFKQSTCPTIKDLFEDARPIEISLSRKTYIAGYTGVDKKKKVFVVAFQSFVPVADFPDWGHFQMSFPKSVEGSMVDSSLLKHWEAAQGPVLQAITDEARKQGKGLEFEIIFTGVGVAAGVATLAAAEFWVLGYRVMLITFGSVMVGNKQFAEFIAAQGQLKGQGGNFRVVYGEDWAPSVPGTGDEEFQHSGQEIQISSSREDKISVRDVQLRDGTYPNDCEWPTDGGMIPHMWYLIFGCRPDIFDQTGGRPELKRPRSGSSKGEPPAQRPRLE